MRTYPSIAIVALGATSLMSACTAGRQPDPSADSNSVNLAPTRSYVATASKISGSAGAEDLVRHALEHAPEVGAGEAKVRRMLAKVPQARALPDPMAKISSGAMAETAAGRAVATTGVEQKLPYPGKLKAMAAAAGKEAEAAAAGLEETRQVIAEEVRSAYWDFYMAGKTKAITTESAAALKLLRETVDAQVAANKATQADQLGLAGEFGKIEKVLVEAGLMEASAKARLNALLNRPHGSALPRPRADGGGSKGELSAMLAKAERDHPSVRAAQAELAAFEHRLERAKLERFPDFSLGVTHGLVSESGLAPSANGRDQVFATLGVSIPLWREPRKAMVEEARAGIDESAAKVGSIRSRLRFRVEEAWLRARAAEQLIALFDKQIIPEAKQAFDVNLAGYSAGTQGYVEVLDSWRDLLGFQLQQAGNRTALGKATAALRRAVGEEL